MSVKLTKKQFEMLEFIEDFIEKSGYSPTYREIMRGLGYKSVATVAKHIDNLVVLGKLEKSENGEARSVGILKNNRLEMGDEEKFVFDFLRKKAEEFSKNGDFGLSKKVKDCLEAIWGK